MGIFFTAANTEYGALGWVKSKIVDSALDFAYKNPLETLVIVGLGSLYAFSHLSDENADFITDLATKKLNELNDTLAPYVQPVYSAALPIYDMLATKFQPVYEACITFLKEIGKEITPFLQQSEMWIRKRFFKLEFDYSGHLLEFAHQNWRKEQVFGNPTVLTRISEKFPVQALIDVTGVLLQSSLINNRYMPKMRYSYPASVLLSLHLFGTTSSLIPID